MPGRNNNVAVPSFSLWCLELLQVESSHVGLGESGLQEKDFSSLQFWNEELDAGGGRCSLSLSLPLFNETEPNVGNEESGFNPCLDEMETKEEPSKICANPSPMGKKGSGMG